MSEILKHSSLLTFDELVADVGKDVLKAIFTERFSFFVWTYLETVVFVERLDIARKPEAFPNGLKNLFESTAQTLERLILTRLCQRLEGKLQVFRLHKPG